MKPARMAGAVLLEAVKEQQEEIEELRAENRELGQRVRKLEGATSSR